MHILLVHQYFLEKDDPGGSRFNEMTREWVEAGHKVTVISGMLNYLTGKTPAKYGGHRFFKETYQDNLTVWRCRVDENYNTNFFGRLKGYFSFVSNAIKAGRSKVEGKFDVLLVTSPPLFLGITAWRLSKILKVPYIFEVRDLWPESAIDTGVVSNPVIIRLAYALEAFIYKKAARINVLTPAFKKTLIEQKKISSSKISFIPNAADFALSDHLLETFDAKSFRQELGIDDRLVITYVGAHGVANHLDQILDAAELVQDTKVLFQLIGDGMRKPALMKMAKQRGLSNIVFRDSVPKQEVFKYILASDLGASVLKKVDTFKTIYSNKTFDYMACQKPVLLCIDGVSRELVANAQCGSYAEPENPVEIARVVRSYFDQPEKIRSEGLNGYHYAKKHFDRSVLANQYLKEMDSVL